MIETKINLKKEDFDTNGELKLSTLLRYMQDAAIDDATKYGATHENLLKENMFFAVYRNILKIKKIITDKTDSFTLVTFQSSHDRMRFIRSYFIYTTENVWNVESEKSPYEDADIYCDSIWVLMDVEKRTLLKSSALLYPVEEYSLPFERTFKVIFDSEKSQKAGTFLGGDYYIDKNGHVNNTAYADIILDFTSVKNGIKYLDITYEHEILENSKVQVTTEKAEDGEKIMGVRESDGLVCFSAEVRHSI